MTGCFTPLLAISQAAHRLVRRAHGVAHHPHLLGQKAFVAAPRLAAGCRAEGGVAAKMLAAALGIATLATPAPALPSDQGGKPSYTAERENATGTRSAPGSGEATLGGPASGGAGLAGQGGGGEGEGGGVSPKAASAPVTAFAPGGLPGIGLGPSTPDRPAELPLGPGVAPLDVGGPATAAVPAPEPPALAAMAGGALLLAFRRRAAAA